jgi:hypothetical protein
MARKKDKRAARPKAEKAAEGLVFRIGMPVPAKENQELLERGFLDFARRGGAEVKAEVIKGPKEWIFRAEFTDPELAIQFTRCFPGGEDAISREVQRHGYVKTKTEPVDPNDVCIAVLFGRNQRVVDVLFHTSIDAAGKAGREKDAPVIIFFRAKHAGGINVDIRPDGACVAEGYGTPSKAVMVRMTRQALKAAIEYGVEQGEALAASAGRA